MPNDAHTRWRKEKKKREWVEPNVPNEWYEPIRQHIDFRFQFQHVFGEPRTSKTIRFYNYFCVCSERLCCVIRWTVFSSQTWECRHIGIGAHKHIHTFMQNWEYHTETGKKKMKLYATRSLQRHSSCLDVWLCGCVCAATETNTTYYKSLHSLWKRHMHRKLETRATHDAALLVLTRVREAKKMFLDCICDAPKAVAPAQSYNKNTKDPHPSTAICM